MIRTKTNKHRLDRTPEQQRVIEEICLLLGPDRIRGVPNIIDENRVSLLVTSPSMWASIHEPVAPQLCEELRRASYWFADIAREAERRAKLLEDSQ